MFDVVKSLPHVDHLVVRMLRGVAHENPAPLGSLQPGECTSILSSLCMTLMRATYHRVRFDEIVDAARMRADQYRPYLVLDAIAKYAAFESVGTLVAARTAVDEIAYIAARRAGEPPARADKFNASNAITETAPTFPELDLIRRGYSEWFKDVNEFRNALAHRGYDEHLGIHAGTSPHKEASRPDWNVLLLPDRASVARPKRPHEWTYTEGRRLEALIADVHHGLVCLLQELGTGLWGGTIPEPGARDVQSQEPMLLVVERSE